MIDLNTKAGSWFLAAAVTGAVGIEFGLLKLNSNWNQELDRTSLHTTGWVVSKGMVQIPDPQGGTHSYERFELFSTRTDQKPSLELYGSANPQFGIVMGNPMFARTRISEDEFRNPRINPGNQFTLRYKPETKNGFGPDPVLLINGIRMPDSDVQQ